jgi:PAS domain S-box-containing protein
MERTHSNPETAELAESRLDATFFLEPDGSITRASAALLQLCRLASPSRLAQLSDLMAERADADHLLRWLRHSRSVAALCLQTPIRVGAGQRLAVDLWVTALPTEGGLQAFCALRLAQSTSAQASELAQQVKRQCATLQQLRQDQKALLASEFRWRFAVEGSGEGVWDWDVTTGEAFFSPLWKRLIGYSEAQISSRFEEWRDRIHPQDLDRVLVALNQYLESDMGSYRMEFRMRCQDGSYAWILSRGMAVVRDWEGRPTRILGTHRNITERVRRGNAGTVPIAS